MTSTRPRTKPAPTVPIPRADFDLLIAATAIHHNLILATVNIRHFTGIDGLVVEDWGEEISCPGFPNQGHFDFTQEIP